MNISILISGILALSTTIGHFTMGSKLYLNPMINSNLELVPKKVMHSVFHYVSVFLITSTIVLLGYGFGLEYFSGSEILIKYIAINYAGFAIWQIFIALTSKIPSAITKLFQWTFFVLIALFAWVGIS